MKITVVTPQGELYNETVDYVVVQSQMNGEFAIMKGHIPIISTIDTGYVKMVRGEQRLFMVVINGHFSFCIVCFQYTIYCCKVSCSYQAA